MNRLETPYSPHALKDRAGGIQTVDSDITAQARNGAARFAFATTTTLAASAIPVRVSTFDASAAQIRTCAFRVFLANLTPG